MEENVRAALWTAQSGGIYNTYCPVARDLWQPLSLGYALGLGLVYCHKSLATRQ